MVLCTDLFCFNKLPSRRSTLTRETRAKGSVYVDERENSFCLTCVLIQNTCILFCFMDFNDYFRFRFKTFDREIEDRKHLSKQSQVLGSNETINIVSLGTFTLKVEGEICS